MHSKLKGSIGELAIAKDLAQKGFKVFTELGDLSKIDIIAEDPEGTLIKVQVKYCTMKDGGFVEVTARKSGPGYEFYYTEKDFDVVAIYCPDIDKVAYMNSKELCSQTQFNLRVRGAKGGGKSTVNYFSSYTCIYRAINNLPIDNTNTKVYIEAPPKKVVHRQTKIEWPEPTKLLDMINKIRNLEEVARQLGVSSNTVRKHCRKLDLDYKQGSVA